MATWGSRWVTINKLSLYRFILNAENAFYCHYTCVQSDTEIQRSPAQCRHGLRCTVLQHIWTVFRNIQCTNIQKKKPRYIPLNTGMYSGILIAVSIAVSVHICSCWCVIRQRSANRKISKHAKSMTEKDGRIKRACHRSTEEALGEEMEVKKNSNNRVREDCEAEILGTIREHAFKIKAWNIYEQENKKRENG